MLIRLQKFVLVSVMSLCASVALAVEQVVSGSAPKAALGTSVSLSPTKMLIGSPGAHGSESDIGSADIYEYIVATDTWDFEATLNASDPVSYAQFGVSVALSEDGNTAVVGASGDDENGSSAGAAYVYEHNGSDWGIPEKLMASDGAAEDAFGSSVAIWGNTIVIGAPGEDGTSGSSKGAAYIFENNGTTWGPGTKKTASDAADDAYFGASVVIEGNQLLVGAYGKETVYAFTHNGTAWSETDKLNAPNGDGESGDYFGRSLSLINEAGSYNIALIGAPHADNANNDNTGAVYVFSNALLFLG